MNLYLVRHGESTGNDQEIHQDASTPLSTRGIGQAQELAKRFQSIDIDICICSPYARAKQTADFIVKQKAIEIVYDDRIVEKKRPTEIEGKSIRDPEAVKVKKEISAHADDPDYHYSDEENAKDTIRRIYGFIKDIEERKEENILVVSHGDAIRTMLLLFMYRDQANPDMWQHFRNFFWESNTAITMLKRYEDTHPYTVHGWKLITWNDHAHLG